MKIKDLKEEHPLIYKRALECQQEQGNQPNDEENLEAYTHNFDWANTKEGYIIWHSVYRGSYSPFYEFHKHNVADESDKIESAIKTLKDAGYKILKPTTTYEEI